MNAVTDDMLVRLGSIISETIHDDEIRAAIITANGRAFCGGTDVTALGRDEEEAAPRQRRAQAVQPPDSPLPTWTSTRIPNPPLPL